jgi:hypothetical protein
MPLNAYLALRREEAKEDRRGVSDICKSIGMESEARN